MTLSPRRELENSAVNRDERPLIFSELVQRGVIHRRHHLRLSLFRQGERPSLLRAWQHLIPEDGEFDRNPLRLLLFLNGETRFMASSFIHEEEPNIQILTVLLLQFKGEILYLIVQVHPTSLHFALLIVHHHEQVGILQRGADTHLIRLPIRQGEILHILGP